MTGLSNVSVSALPLNLVAYRSLLSLCELPNLGHALKCFSSSSFAQQTQSVGMQKNGSKKPEGRNMPRVILHRTKREVLSSISAPPVDTHGPLQSLLRGDGITASTSYRDDQVMQTLASHRRSDRRADVVRLLRRHNYSMPGIAGQTIEARVLMVGSETIYVDPGFYGISQVPRSEASLSQLCTSDGQIPSGRSSSSDIRVGDVISVKVESLFSPYGDMQVEAVQADEGLKISSLWRELATAHATKTPVSGRVLNACTGGYAVGIGGIVGLMPYGRFTLETASKIGVLQKFYVERVVEERRQLVVADAKKETRRLV
ncbi:hypothetical protein CEUSTIGMA_g8084.t1 [Chlamydomonas eustigma]|uniref:S1 motif domain-containing protein n=1 Tax=Chlamydomonas eustigma TaxID=1157962 RepID=A0A250XCN3_9CHLO|nr:hypothetical protein CEUSTIGMA_g8084.t1 [Chlamydomonas eustigma]|eukprot:GAX80649.1 hypothetical protein CEUSTIGMA_g8084.t1 [Chlamydomonas eustigma]